MEKGGNVGAREANSRSTVSSAVAELITVWSQLPVGTSGTPRGAFPTPSTTAHDSTTLRNGFQTYSTFPVNPIFVTVARRRWARPGRVQPGQPRHAHYCIEPRLGGLCCTYWRHSLAHFTVRTYSTVQWQYCAEHGNEPLSVPAGTRATRTGSCGSGDQTEEIDVARLAICQGTSHAHGTSGAACGNQ